MMSSGDPATIGRPTARWYEYAPPPLRDSLLALGVMLAPAIAGIALGWPRYVTYALLLPGFVMSLVYGKRAAHARGEDYRRERPSGASLVVVSGFCGLLGALTADLKTAYAPLVLVLLLAGVAEPLTRLIWRRHRGPTQPCDSAR
jgi:hypothetical protein